MNTEQLRAEFEAYEDRLIAEAESAGDVCVTVTNDAFTNFSAGYQAAAKSRDELIGKLVKAGVNVLIHSMGVNVGNKKGESLYALNKALAEAKAQRYGE